MQSPRPERAPPADDHTPSLDFLLWSGWDAFWNLLRGNRRWTTPKVRQARAHLQAAVNEGAIVIFAHCGLPYFAPHDLTPALEHNDFKVVKQLLTAVAPTSPTPGRFFADVSACCTPFRRSSFHDLAALPPDRLLLGSDFPTPVFELSADAGEMLDELWKSQALPVINVDATSRLAVLSDLHLGDGGDADDMRPNGDTLMAALTWYRDKGFTLVLLGDVEELWQFELEQIEMMVQVGQDILARWPHIRPEHHHGHHDVCPGYEEDVTSFPFAQVLRGIYADPTIPDVWTPFRSPTQRQRALVTPVTTWDAPAPPTTAWTATGAASATPPSSASRPTTRWSPTACGPPLSAGRSAGRWRTPVSIPRGSRDPTR